MSRFVRETIETDWKHGGQVGFERTVVHADCKAMGDAIEALERRVNSDWSSTCANLAALETRITSIAADISRVEQKVEAAPKKAEPLADGEYVVRWADTISGGVRAIGRLTGGVWWKESARGCWGAPVGIKPTWIGPRVDMMEG